MKKSIKILSIISFMIIVIVMGINNIKAENEYESFYDEVITYKTCGSIDRIPNYLPKFTNALYKIIKFLVPILLIVLGIKDYLQAVASKNKDLMNEQQKKFIRRIAAAILVFFVFAFVQFLIRLLAMPEKSDTLTCIDCFVNNENKCGTSTFGDGAVNGGMAGSTGGVGGVVGGGSGGGGGSATESTTSDDNSGGGGGSW